jgi:integrase
MSLKLIPPKAGRSPYYRVRGTFLGIQVDRSTQLRDPRLAEKVRERWEREIVRGEYRQSSGPDDAPRTFLDAAIAYMQAGGDSYHLGPIIRMTGEAALNDIPLEKIDQIAIDRAASALFPNAPAPTKNRNFYTPVSAVLKRAGIDKAIKRPKGWRGKKSVSWLEPEQAFALLAAAEQLDPEFGMFCRLLCYTGMRLGEALAIKVGAVDLERRAIYLPETKNGESRTVHLTPELVVALANHPRGLDRPADERLVRFSVSGRFRAKLKRAMKAAGLSFPRRQAGYHLFCHTYATWMRRYNGMDNYALARTGRWKDPRSVDVYLHTETSAEARMADNLPTKRSV